MKNRSLALLIAVNYTYDGMSVCFRMRHSRF